MTGLRWPARLYWAGVILAAVGLFAFTAVYSPFADGQHLVPILVFTGLVTLAKRFPLHFALRTKLTLDTTVLFAAILLFDPASAMALAGSGTLLAQTIGRGGWVQTPFNSAQAMLKVGAGALLLAGGGWNVEQLAFDHPERLLMPVVAAGAMHVIDTLVVQVMVALQMSLSPRLLWRRAIGLAAAEELAQFALGLLAAAVVDAHPWALPLFALPAFAVYRSFERHVQLRRHAVEAIEALASIVDIRDRYTAAHSRRVAALARDLAIALDLPPQEVETIERAARLHDVGKIVIDSAVLAKEGRLTAAEWEEMKRHPVVGAQILSRFPQFAPTTRYVRHHHERVDGGGYPDGLRDEAIPLGARIIAVADALDAMVNTRPYRRALSPEFIKAEFARQRGRQWDERVVDRLFDLVDGGRIALTSERAPNVERAAPPGPARNEGHVVR